MVSQQGFEVQHDALHTATGALPKQVTALGGVRKVLTARQLPAEAFANVDVSPQISSNHSGVVGDLDQRLAAASGRLDEIIGAIDESDRTTREWDDAKARQQQEQGAGRLAQLAQSGPSAGTITWPDGKTTEMNPGGTYYAPKYRNPGDAVTTFPSGQILRRVPQPNGDDLFILRDGTNIYFTDRPIPDS